MPLSEGFRMEFPIWDNLKQQPLRSAPTERTRETCRAMGEIPSAS